MVERQLPKLHTRVRFPSPAPTLSKIFADGFTGSFTALGLVMFSAGVVVTESKGVVQINKIAAAQRQLDSAVRMFFQKEDELAVHVRFRGMNGHQV
jgi:hypothetical protein